MSFSANNHYPFPDEKFVFDPREEAACPYAKIRLPGAGELGQVISDLFEGLGVPDTASPWNWRRIAVDDLLGDKEMCGFHLARAACLMVMDSMFLEDEHPLFGEFLSRFIARVTRRDPAVNRRAQRCLAKFYPFTQGSIFTREQMNSLFGAIEQESPFGTESRIEEAFSGESEMFEMPTKLFIGSLEPLLEYLNEFIHASSEAEAAHVLRAHPQLLSDTVDSILVKLIGDAQADGNEGQARLLAERLQLQQSRRLALSTESSSGFLQAGGGSLIPGLEELLGAKSWVAAQRVVIEHPELLGDEADIVLTQLITDADTRSDEEVAEHLKGIHELLRQFRVSQITIEHIRTDNEDDQSLADELDLLLAELEGLEELTGLVDGDFDRLQAGMVDLSRYRTVLDRATLVLTPERYPDYWAIVQAMRGIILLSESQTDPTELKRAIDYLEAALSVFTPTRLPGMSGMIQLALGVAHGFRGEAADLEKAIAYAERSLTAFPPNALTAQWAKAKCMLGVLYARRIYGSPADNIEQGIRHCEATLEQLMPNTLPAEWGMTLYTLGSLYLDRIIGDPAANLERAIASFEEALRIRTRDTRPDEWAATQHALGSAHAAHAHRLGEDRLDHFEQAFACFEEALRIRTRDTRPDEWAATQHALGSAHVAHAHRLGKDRADHLEQAIACFETALDLSPRDTRPEEYAELQIALGSVYSERPTGDPIANLERAVRCHEAALKIRTRKATPTEWAIIQNNLGTLCAYHADRFPEGREASLEQAITCFENALSVFEEVGWSARCQETGQALGDVGAEAGRWDKAVQGYQVALDASERLYNTSIIGSAKAVELARTSGLHEHAAYALARTGQLKEAVIMLEQGRARVLGEIMTRERINLDEIQDHDAIAAEAYRQAVERVHNLESNQWRVPSRMPKVPTFLSLFMPLQLRVRSGIDHEAEQALETEAKDAYGELADAIERIRRLGFEGFLAPPSFDDIASAVVPGTPLVYIAWSPFGCLTLLLHHSSEQASEQTTDTISVAIKTVEVLGNGRTLTAELPRLLTMMDGDKATGGYLRGLLGDHEQLEECLPRVLKLLGEQLIRPLAVELADLDAQGVVLVVGGRLGLLPLHAAPYKRKGKTTCLLDNLDVSYTPSVRMLSASRSALTVQERQGRTPLLAGVGNPLPDPSPLAFAQPELEEVAATFQETDFAAEVDLVLFGEKATKSALIMAADKASHVHLACHGRFETNRPLSSGLKLAQGEQLTLSEILMRRPFANARLIVASACQTAISDFTHGIDEWIGLPAAFLQAGVPGVVGTLWEVDDLSSALMMVRFYEYHLSGDPETGEVMMSPTRALRMAQRWLRGLTAKQLDDFFKRHPRLAAAAKDSHLVQGIRDSRSTGPYHWAAYIMIGV